MTHDHAERTREDATTPRRSTAISQESPHPRTGPLPPPPGLAVPAERIRRRRDAGSADPLGGTALDGGILEVLRRRRHSGGTLPGDVSERMGTAFGVDLSAIRVHRDQEADQLARSVQAEAFAFGTDLYFRQGNFAPHTSRGAHLLAHEIAHTLQSPAAGQSAPLVGRTDDPAEVAAENVARQVTARIGTQQPATGRAEASTTSGVAIHRTIGIPGDGETLRRTLEGVRSGDRVSNDKTHEEYDVIGIHTDDELGQELVTLKANIDVPPIMVPRDGKYTKIDQEPSKTPELKKTLPPPLPPKFTLGTKKPIKGQSILDLYAEWGLTLEESNALSIYTTSAYKQINNYLRNRLELAQRRELTSALSKLGGGDDDTYDRLVSTALEHESPEYQVPDIEWDYWRPVIAKYVEIVSSAMAKVPKPDESIVYRGVALDTKPDFLKMHAPGEVVSDPGFLSTAFGTPFAKDSLVVIRLPLGHPGRKITLQSAFGANEAEILFPPGTGYSIDRTLERKPKIGIPSKPTSDDYDYASAADRHEFDHVLAKVVPNAEERASRFGIVKRIYFTTLSAPKKT